MSYGALSHRLRSCWQHPHTLTPLHTYVTADSIKASIIFAKVCPLWDDWGHPTWQDLLTRAITLALPQVWQLTPSRWWHPPHHRVPTPLSGRHKKGSRTSHSCSLVSSLLWTGLCMCQMHLLGMTQDCTLCVCICYPRNGSSKCGRSAGNPLAQGTECLCSDGVF